MRKIISRVGAVLILLAMVSAQIGYAADSHHGTKSLHSSQQAKTDSKAPVDINVADAKTLTTLKGIGAKKSQAIIKYREKNGNFKSLQDVAAVKGIGEKGLARIIKNNPNRMVINP